MKHLTTLALILSSLTLGWVSYPAPGEAAPFIDSIQPTEVKALGLDVLTITGGNFITPSGDLQISAGPLIVRPADIISMDDTTIVLHAPDPQSLGQHPVQVATDQGQSGSVAFNYAQVDPPLLLFPALLAKGSATQLHYAGAPFADVSLLVNTTGATQIMGGDEVLTPELVVGLSPVNGAGVGHVVAAVPLVFPSGVLFFQVLLTSPGDGAAEVTNIGSTTFINP